MAMRRSLEGPQKLLNPPHPGKGISRRVLKQRHSEYRQCTLKAVNGRNVMPHIARWSITGFDRVVAATRSAGLASTGSVLRAIGLRG